ncbi:response regulator transcription factor [Curvibacter sp. CHRR-16]|uniref:response regulator n=1 Tax=Curvibacter sp. CHRR-16 TaxID=2835872 RepID=UPI001BDB0E6A|nr:response regulator transcription factor [Curvibacter sp. CHRR-16]MBT0569511.1 response regulator transcription factor [Curvibacter sp. CHRR-16]
MIDVIICDDHAMIRRGIRDTLTEAVDLRVLAEAGNYGELKEQLRQHPCHVVVLDINLPGRSGLETLSSIRESYPEVKVLIVSMYPEEQYAIKALKLGAFGYLNKADDPAQLIDAVRTVAQGRKFLTPALSELLVTQLSSPVPQAPHDALSDREMQTLLLIAQGKKLSDIADELALSPKTVSVYRARLLEKLHLSSNAELAVYAIRNQLV